MTRCGELPAVYPDTRGGWTYDLYAVSGALVAGGIRHRKRIVALEGPFFYSVRAVAGSGAEDDRAGASVEEEIPGPSVRQEGERPGARPFARLRVWQLSYPAVAAR